MVRGTYCRGVQGDDRRRSTRGVFFFCRNLFYPAMGVWQMFFYSLVHCQGDLKPSGHRQGPAAGHRKRIGGAPWQGGSGPSKRPVTVGEAYERRHLPVVEQSATPPTPWPTPAAAGASSLGEGHQREYQRTAVKFLPKGRTSRRSAARRSSGLTASSRTGPGRYLGTGRPTRSIGGCFA